MAPVIIIIVVCVPPLLTTRAIMPLWYGSDGRGGGEDKRVAPQMTDRSAESGADVESLLASDPPLSKEAWIRMQGWYKYLVEPPPPARVTIDGMTEERVAIYFHVHPPDRNIPVEVTPLPRKIFHSGGGGGCRGGQASTPGPLRRAIRHSGRESITVDTGGDVVEVTGCHQLGEGGCAGAGGVLRGVPCKGMCLAEVCDDSQGVRKGLQRHWVSGGPVEGHHWYH